MGSKIPEKLQKLHDCYLPRIGVNSFENPLRDPKTKEITNNYYLPKIGVNGFEKPLKGPKTEMLQIITICLGLV